MTLPTVALTGAVSSLTGQPGNGYVLFEAPTAVADSAGTVLGNYQPVGFQVSAGSWVGTPAVLASDAGAITPTGWSYKITVRLDVWQTVFYAPVPASPSTTTLGALYSRSAPAPTPGTSYVPNNLVGQPNGLATLGSDGLLTTAQRPPSGGGSRVAIVSGSFTTGNVSAVNTAGAWQPIAGTLTAISAVVGDQLRAEFGFLTQRGAGTYYDVGVVAGGSIVRLLNAPSFPPDVGYEGMTEANPDSPADFFGPSIDPWFTAVSGDVVGGAITFCLAWKSTGAGQLLMSTDVPVTYNLYNNHQ